MPPHASSPQHDPPPPTPPPPFRHPPLHHPTPASPAEQTPGPQPRHTLAGLSRAPHSAPTRRPSGLAAPWERRAHGPRSDSMKEPPTNSADQPVLVPPREAAP